jgi:hypothetical protein
VAAGAPKHGRPARVTQRRAPSAGPSLAGLLGPACRAHPVRQNPNAGGGRPLNPVARDTLPRWETGGVFVYLVWLVFLLFEQGGDRNSIPGA